MRTVGTGATDNHAVSISALASAKLRSIEHELIRARTGEGRARAKARGVHMGRPPKLTARQRQEALARRDAAESLSDIARTYGVAR